MAVCEGVELLALPVEELAEKLVSRDREMVRLRNSSPFYLTEGVDFGDYRARLRLRRAARRVVARGSSPSILSIQPERLEIVTVPQRKAREAERRRISAEEVMAEAKEFAIARGGRFWIFGSVAEGRRRFDIDFDVIMDFPSEIEAEAAEFIQDSCRRRRLPSDVHSKSWARERFLNRIRERTAILLP